MDTLNGRRLVLSGQMQSMTNFHMLWESIVAMIIQNEHARPAVFWAATLEADVFIRDMQQTDTELLKVFSNLVLENRIGIQSAVELVSAHCKESDITLEYNGKTLDGASIAVALCRYSLLIDKPTKPLSGLFNNKKKKTPTQMKHMGICGGMGPIAGASFAVDLGALLHGEQLPEWTFYMYSDPSVESYKDESILTSLQSGYKLLSFIKNTAFDCTCVPSNTAHLVWAMTNPPPSMISIFDAVVSQIKRHTKRPVGFMTTDRSLQFFSLGYKSVLTRNFIECVLLNNKMQQLCMAGINQIKSPSCSSENKQGAKEKFIQCATWLYGQGARIIIMACTEIPLAIDSSDFLTIKDLHLLDSSHCLALSVYDTIHATGITDRSI